MAKWTFEVDAQLYEAAAIIAKENGTTVEQMVTEFIRWCAAEETHDEAIRQIKQWMAAQNSDLDFNASDALMPREKRNGR